MKLVDILYESGYPERMKLDDKSLCSRTGLAVDTETNIVYYKFSESRTVSKSCFEENPLKMNIGYMCPYLGKHGRPCRFVDDKIVEISSAKMMAD